MLLKNSIACFHVLITQRAYCYKKYFMLSSLYIILTLLKKHLCFSLDCALSIKKLTYTISIPTSLINAFTNINGKISSLWTRKVNILSEMKHSPFSCPLPMLPGYLPICHLPVDRTIIGCSIQLPHWLFCERNGNSIIFCINIQDKHNVWHFGNCIILV